MIFPPACVTSARLSFVLPDIYRTHLRRVDRKKPTLCLRHARVSAIFLKSLVALSKEASRSANRTYNASSRLEKSPANAVIIAALETVTSFRAAAEASSYKVTTASWAACGTIPCRIRMDQFKKAAGGRAALSLASGTCPKPCSCILRIPIYICVTVGCKSRSSVFSRHVMEEFTIESTCRSISNH